MAVESNLDYDRHGVDLALEIGDQQSVSAANMTINVDLRARGRQRRTVG